MKQSEFWALLEDEFGSANASIIASSLELPGLRASVRDSLANGTDPRLVWTAICDLHDIPAERRLGKDKEPRDTGAL